MYTVVPRWKRLFVQGCVQWQIVFECAFGNLVYILPFFVDTAVKRLPLPTDHVPVKLVLDAVPGIVLSVGKNDMMPFNFQNRQEEVVSICDIVRPHVNIQIVNLNEWLWLFLSSQTSINRTLPWEKCSIGQKVRSEQSVLIITESGLCVARSGNKKVKFVALVIQDYDYTITMVHKTAENHMFVCGTDGAETTCCNMVGGSRAIVNLL